MAKFKKKLTLFVYTMLFTTICNDYSKMSREIKWTLWRNLLLTISWWSSYSA